MAKILREPLLHFLLLGGALFLVFQQLSDQAFTADDQLEEILVNEGRIQSLQFGFEKVWQRPPTQRELDGLIENFVREEVLYREALAMGLDRDDPIVRRRLRQKIEFLSEDLAGLEQPDDATLQTFLSANSETYRQPSRFSFRQVYINASQRGQRAQSDAIELLAKLRTQELETDVTGDSLMLKHQFIDETERDIERTLGRQFLTSLRETPVGEWQGPIASGFGLHLVKISERFDGEIPDLDSVREAVFRDWSSEKRKQTNELFYETLRKRYEVTVKSEK